MASSIAEQALYDGAVFEMQIIPHFLEAAVTGLLPNNKRTSVPLLSRQELRDNYEKDYCKWARGTYRSLDGSPSGRVKKILTPKEDISRLESAPANLKIIKSKVWEGISLISTDMWLSKRLDSQERINQAMQYIRLCINSFHYLHQPITQGNMRDTYNRVYTELKTFQDAVNMRRTLKGEAALLIATLWAQFIKAQFEVVAQVARFWIFVRLTNLQASCRGRIANVFLSGRQLDSTQSTVRVDHLALAVFKRLVDLGIEADKVVRVSTVGFNELSEEGGGISHEELMQIHTAKEKQFRKRYNDILNTMRASETATRRSTRRSVLPEFIEEIEIVFDRQRAHRRIQPGIDRFNLTPTPEPWVNCIKRGPPGEFGFVAYRISYKETDEEWEAFLKKLRVGIDTWTGFAGSGSIKGNAKFQWIDGRQENIAQGDLRGVRKHFKKFISDKGALSGMHEGICLAIDAACIKSYDFKPSELAIHYGMAADFHGYVIVIDSNYNEETIGKSSTSAYQGHVRVLDTVLMTEFYPMLCMNCVSLEVMWQAAIDHPWHVYVGPTVEAERNEWKRMKLEAAKILANAVLVFARQNNLLSESIA